MHEIDNKSTLVFEAPTKRHTIIRTNIDEDL